jgi:hypothetical protein
MKTVILLIFSLFYINTYAQSNEPKYFAQCLFDISDAEKIKELESEMRTHPSLAVVRLDVNTKRAFILGKEGIVITESDFISWFNEYSSTVKCVQIGVHGIDQVNPYPFKNCH